MLGERRGPSAECINAHLSVALTEGEAKYQYRLGNMLPAAKLSPNNICRGETHQLCSAAPTTLRRNNNRGNSDDSF